MIDIFDKLNAAYGDQTIADSDQIKDKKFGKKQDVLNKEILDPDDPNSLKSKVDSFNGIVIDPDNVVSTDKSDIEVGSSKIPTGNAVAGALSDAVLKAGVFDISAYNLTNDQPTPYADLEAALGNNGENVPEAVRKGGMQVKFIQGSVGSSDNKYVQYRLTADDWSTDTEDWTIADEGVYVENPEYFYVKTDAEGKILWAIKVDGSIYYGAGVPQQVVDYINERIAELSLDEYEDIVVFLNDLEKGDKTLQTLLDEKVDKEEGKSLIDGEYASTKSTIDNPEFLEVTTDSEDKVLEGIQANGNKVIGGDINIGGSASVSGDIKILGNMGVSGVSYKVIENPEYLAAWIDSEGKVIFGLRTDGKTYVGDADFLNEIRNNKNVTSEIISIIDKFFVGKRVSILGDSISTFNKEGYKIENYPMYYPTAAGDRGDDVKTVNDTWWKQVIDNIGGILEVNASYSGSTASNLVKGFSSRVPLLGNPDIIYIALGTNDSYNYVDIGDIDYDAESYDLSKFAPAYIQGLKDVFALYPEAEVICVAFDMGEAYQNTIKTIVEHYRWSHNIQYMYVGDISDVHPNKAEMKAVADEINDTLPMLMIENPEFIDVETDIEGKILSSRDNDGVKKEYVGFETPKMSIDGHSLKNIKDIEGRTEILTDNEGKIISYRDSNGVKHEEVGIETNQLLLTKEGMEDFQQQLNESGFLPNKSVSIKEYDLPKFGYVNLVSETFYLTAAGWSSYANDVELIQDYEDTNENAWNKVTIAHFYIKGTQTKLDFYAASKVTKIADKYYVTSTLTEIVDPVTGDVTYEVNENSVEVRQCVDVPPYKAWPVDKKTEHYCVVEIDFGHYLNGTFPVGIKYQGSSTLQWRKRNFRFTFYKNNKYEKKNKVKIGEFVRLNGFNLKANWTDNTKIKELFMNILFMAIWENRGKCTSYPWDGDDAPYNGATGMIKGFPIEVNVGGIFYGLDIFGLKKDGKNYLLDKDEDGMIEGGTRNDVGCWETAAPIDWEDELNDEEDWVIDNQTQSNYDALIDFFAFINGTLEEEGVIVPFDKSTMPERMFMPAWIDYLICLQVFLMLDSTCRNVMLYTGSDKKKFYPFFYDLDASMKYGNPTMDIMIPNGSPDWQEGGCYAYDLSLWEHIKEEWWDEIVNRYHELRHSILSDEYIKAVYEEILNNIPDEEYSKESQRWGLQVSKQNFYETINQLKVRFNWLDNEYYK